MKKTNEKAPRITWADLKKAVNELPEDLLTTKVVLWPFSDGEEAWNLVEVMTLEEDYVFDGDSGCAPLSVMKESVSAEEWEEAKDEHHLVFPKGTPILIIE
jgi:hypothetical protein